MHGVLPLEHDTVQEPSNHDTNCRVLFKQLAAFDPNDVNEQADARRQQHQIRVDAE